MPWPAKPPMTLKEAKRAYKKNGAVSRYTASQMDRADRIDAREERRKKAVEKERQRFDNKRKREEKESKDRNVRQKMLEEGRINLEDTWGKVTASQPRLNMFFGRNTVKTSAKSNLKAEVKAVDIAANNAAQDTFEGELATTEDEAFRRGQDGAQQPESTVMQGDARDIPKTTESALSSTQDPDQIPGLSNDAQPSQTRPFSSAHSRRATLRDLNSSQINARSSAPASSSNSIKTTPRKPTITSQSSSYASRSRARASSTITRKPPPSTSGGNTLSEGIPTELLPARKELRQITDESNREAQPGQSPLLETTRQNARHREDRPPSSFLSLDVDEDFTDGIDDETFLMLCSTQKPAPRGTTDSVAATGKSLPLASNKANQSCLSEELKQDAMVTTSDLCVEIDPSILPVGLTESFNSVFNEIEDEDLIALAEEVEAELATPNQTPTLPAVQKVNKARHQPPLQQHARESLRVISKAHSSPPRQTRVIITAPKPTSTLNTSRQTVGNEASSCVPTIGTDLRALGTNSRLPETNPRATGTIPRIKAIPFQAKGTYDQTTQSPSLSMTPKRMSPTFKHPSPPPLRNAVHAPLTAPPASQPKKMRRLPLIVNPPEEEFPGLNLGPSTQALTLELLERVEAQISQESGTGVTSS